MIDIQKHPEPKSLTLYRENKEDNPTYSGFREKDEIRECLLREQGGVCCYCMGRIGHSNMKIEHRQPQNGTARDLEWKNLLGACRGNEGHPPSLQHCDTRKGNAEILLDPTAGVEHAIRYGSNGEMFSTNPAWNKEIDDTLNLNVELLRERRRKAVAGFVAAMTKRKRHGVWSRKTLERKLDTLTSSVNVRKEPYCGVIAFWIAKKMASCPNR